MKTNILLNVISAFLIMTSSVTAYADDSKREGDYIKGAKAWSSNCVRCHNLRSPKELTDDQWKTTMFHMRVRAGLTGQETRDILSFLQKSN